jgi:pyrimidine operon attenuation protein / uracil phosphoribosyltransferase
MVSEVLSEVQLERHTTELAARISEDHPGDFVLIGIATGGAHLALRIQALLASRHHRTVPLGELDITLYRDDLYTGLERPALGATHIQFSIDGASVVLIDDVLFTGRTVRAALQELTDYGRPRSIRLAVLVDRGHRELPIQADYVGFCLDTEKRDRINVLLKEGMHKKDAVILEPAAP